MRTIDFEQSNGSRYYTVSKLGPKRSLTPEGYLLCQDVPVARTGEMLYAEGELIGDDGEMIRGGPDKLIRVSRDAQELFRAETVASFEGKPVTLSHPDDFVGPDNFAAHARGTMVNVRRGSGLDDELMVADLLISDAAAIKAVQADGIEEVSLGYEADYLQQDAGRAAQHNIVGNHLALVERGRCGPRCAIGDEAMASKKRNKFTDLLMRAFKAKDAAEVEKIAKEAESEDEEGEEEREARELAEERQKTNDTLAQVLDKLGAIDERLDKLEAADGDDDVDDDAGKTADDVIEAETAPKLDESGVKLYTGDAARGIPALAEIIAPGTRMPTLDAKTTDAQRAAALCSCQRRALATAYRTHGGRGLISPLLGGLDPDFAKLPAATLNAVFHGAAQMFRTKNNDANRRATLATRDFSKPTAVAPINAQNREYWDNRNRR